MFKKVIFVNLVIMVFSLAGYCFSEDELNYLEINRYGKTYNLDSIGDRLTRLETDILGTRQSGDIDNRIRVLNAVASDAISLPSSDFYPNNKKSAIRNIWDNISSSFSNEGFLTGYVPPMTYGDDYMGFFDNGPKYCPYHNTYHRKGIFNRRASGYKSVRNHYRPRHYNPYGPNYERPTYGMTSMSTGSTVRILND